jgi:hypothetical protein
LSFYFKGLRQPGLGVVGVNRFATIRAGHLWFGDVTAGFVNDLDGRILGTQPTIAPLFQRDDDRPQIATFLGQAVFMA